MSDPSVEKQLAQCEGKIGIMVDRTLVSRVRVSGVTVHGSLVRFRYEALETPGLNRAAASPDHVLAADADGFADPMYWVGHHVGWRIVFDPRVIERVLAIVSVLPDGTTYLDDYTAQPAKEGARFEVRTPGPVAAALSALIRDLG